MNEAMYDVAIVGGGPAGLAAAYSARRHGAGRVLILERDRELGGILQQCIHNGFGLHRFHQELTGPGYAARYIRMIHEQPGIDVLLDTMVLETGEDKTIWAVNPRDGIVGIKARAVVLAMGCRERTRGAIRIPGQRPAGVLTAGAAQRMVNMEGYLPGKEIVVLGSGDIGLIMARRMTLEGARVRAVLEIMPYSNGLTRNIVQCLEDYNIPLYLSHTIVQINGRERVSGVVCAKVDENRMPVAGSEFELSCDCLLLSVGLIPENELSHTAGVAIDPVTGGPVVNQRRETSLAGFFAAGNVVHVHDLVDWVSEEGEIAGKQAALYAGETLTPPAGRIALLAGQGIRSVVPQVIDREENGAGTIRIFTRVAQPERQAVIQFHADGSLLFERRLPVVKPSEMVVMDVPAAKFGPAKSSVNIILSK